MYSNLLGNSFTFNSIEQVNVVIKTTHITKYVAIDYYLVFIFISFAFHII